MANLVSPSLKSFNPADEISEDSNLFGWPGSEEQSSVIIQPVPWEATTSYLGGTSKAPELIRLASHQMDLFSETWGETYTKGFYLAEPNLKISQLNDNALELKNNKKIPSLEISQRLNLMSAEVNALVYEKTSQTLKQNKIPALIGGEHSVIFGQVKAVSEQLKNKNTTQWGLVHIDAHLDLRNAYQGFEHSHASAIRHVFELDNSPSHSVHFGIRDYCKEESDYMKDLGSNYNFFTDRSFQQSLEQNISHDKTSLDFFTNEFQKLPQDIYISWDIDGLDPQLCPNTGTPVPGGLNWHQALTLIFALKQLNKNIVGFDLVEVSESLNPNSTTEWNSNVGARLFYELCCLAVC